MTVYTNSSVASAGTSWSLLYKNTVRDSIVNTMYIANIDGTSDVEFYMSVTDGNATDGDGTNGTFIAWLAYKMVITAGTTVSFVGEDNIILDRNQKIWVKSNTANGLSIFASVSRTS